MTGPPAWHWRKRWRLLNINKLAHYEVLRIYKTNFYWCFQGLACTNRQDSTFSQFLLITNLTHFFQCIYLFPFSTCFEQLSAHHQENPIVSIHHLAYITLCRWLPGMPVRRDQHTRQSPTQSDMIYTRWCIDTIWFSWWWALGCSKHVEKGNK
jgi:hypothetical protein